MSSMAGWTSAPPGSGSRRPSGELRVGAIHMRVQANVPSERRSDSPQRVSPLRQPAPVTSTEVSSGPAVPRRAELHLETIQLIVRLGPYLFALRQLCGDINSRRLSPRDDSVQL